MRQEEIFGNAQWVGAGEGYGGTEAPDAGGKPHFPILRRVWMKRDAAVRQAMLHAVGLGFFHCRLDGKRIGEEEFLPLATDYEPRRNYPTGETLTGHRILVPKWDVTALLAEAAAGAHVLTLHFGGGWYTYTADGVRFGDPKAIYCLRVTYEDGSEDTFVSGEEDYILPSYVQMYHFTTFEAQDWRGFEAGAFTAVETLGTPACRMTPPADTVYAFSDCPADRVVKRAAPRLIGEKDGVRTYDAGENLSGWPLLLLKGAAGETVTVLFSEEKTADNEIDPRYHHGQRFTVCCDGQERRVRPWFTWFGFRYFSLTGNAEPLTVEMVHADVPVQGTFRTDNDALNWLYTAYIRTQLCNLHAGIPSDCPHLERRGYTGDGQLTCHAAMTMLDARSVYEKWIGDIADCQDVYSGHVQYTAPYYRSGGGPGGWGCAIVEVPYQYYRHYGDARPFAALYPQMLRYFQYLEAHSAGDLVCRDKEGEWCLGEWCTPGDVILPAPFINNYYYIKSLERMAEMAPVVGRAADVPAFLACMERKRAAVRTAYCNTWDGNFFGGLQGANAFAVDMGVGDERTYANLVSYYRALGRLDTGIFGCDVVLRVLFANGDGALAAALLSSTKDGTYDHWHRLGATTLWEYWPDHKWERSHSHPMFGAPAAYLFSELAGIQPLSPGYARLRIAPVLTDGVHKLLCTQTIPAGEVSVSYRRQPDGTVDFHVALPDGVPAVFVWNGEESPLSPGVNRFTVSAQAE